MTGRTVTAVTTTPLDPEPSPPADATHVSDGELWDDQGVFRYYSTDCGHGVALRGFQSFDGTDRQKWITGPGRLAGSPRRLRQHIIQTINQTTPAHFGRGTDLVRQ